VLEEARAWQSQQLEQVHAVVFPAAIMAKVRDNQVVQDKPANLAVGIDGDGVLGMWLAKTAPQTATGGEGARLWNSVMTDLRNRGVRDILVARCDGLAGSGRLPRPLLTGPFLLGNLLARAVARALYWTPLLTKNPCLPGLLAVIKTRSIEDRRICGFGCRGSRPLAHPIVCSV
jgi:Transposase, Mutator family